MHDTTEHPSQSSTFYAWYVALIFGLANFISFLDRYFINLVLDPIRETFGLTDTQVGWLVGPAFMAFYLLAALPIGKLADTYSRKRLIAAGVLGWSFSTAACGGANGYAGIVAARMGIGLGEATLTPSAVSVLSDYHPARRLARAVSLFTACGTLGASAAMIGGGYFLGWASQFGTIALPILGDREPWQIAFLLLGLPGILLSLLIILTIREPKRRGKTDKTPKASWSHTFAYLRAHPKATLMVVAGFSVISAGSGGSWIPTFFGREYGLKPSEFGPILGMIQLFCGAGGVLFGGFCADYFRGKGYADATVRVAIAALCVVLPCELIMPNAGSAELSYLFYGLAMFFMMMCFGCSTPSMAMIAPPEMRSQLVTVYLLAGNLVGLGLSPVLVPLITDYVFGDPQALRYSLTIVCGVLIGCALIMLILSRQAFRDRVLAIAADAAKA